MLAEITQDPMDATTTLAIYRDGYAYAGGTTE